jgi:putative ABC transport system permease protein
VSGHNLRIALRRLGREKSYAFINVLSLGLAVTCCLVVFLYIRNELTYDRHNRDYDRIYRVVNETTTNGRVARYAYTSHALAPLFRSDYPDAGESVRFRNLVMPRVIFKYKETQGYWDDVRFADTNVFDVFTHKPVFGELKSALKDPSSIVISRSFAQHYFGERNPVGETISTDTFDYRITAVFEDLPRNSHLRYSALISMERLRAFGIADADLSPQQLPSLTSYTYFKLPANADPKAFEGMLAGFSAKYATAFAPASIRLFAQPLADIHFDTGFRFDQPTGNIFYVRCFVAVAIFLILVACINYTNMATARAAKRASEIGIRKAIGAQRFDLVAGFLWESVIYVLIATAVGVLVLEAAQWLTPFGSLFAGKAVLDLWSEPALLAWILLGALIIGLLAGVYPALYLSSISPLAALTLTRKEAASGLSLRHLLVFVQIFVSIGVIAATLSMARQMQYVMNKPLGFERDNRLVILLRGVDVLERIPLIENELRQHPNILGVAKTSFAPGDEVPLNVVPIETNEGQMETAPLNDMMVAEEFISVMGIRVRSGRDFSARLLTDTGMSVVVNEALVRQMGWREPIGKRIGGNGRVVGVVEDFHFASLHESVGPVVLRPFPKNELDGVRDLERNLIWRLLVVRIMDGRKSETLEYIRSTLSKFDPGHPLEYQYLDDLLRQQYRSENNLIAVAGVFSIICIFISCMGLLGLATFTTAQRQREIAIRRVLGSSVLEIIYLLSKSLLMLVAVAAALASAASFVVINDWLSAFAYRAEVELWIFLVSSVAVAFLGLWPVAVYGMKSALSNPARSLSYE